MNIDLFAEMLKNLILDHDEVLVKGLGTFVAELVPASFSDNGYTINPPYRKLALRQRKTADANLLRDEYSRISGLGAEAAERELDDFIAGMKETLIARKSLVFPGLGRVRATKENAFFFLPDEDLDIYPYGIGLEPVSLRTVAEIPDQPETAETVDVTAAFEETKTAESSQEEGTKMPDDSKLDESGTEKETAVEQVTEPADSKADTLAEDIAEGTKQAEEEAKDAGKAGKTENIGKTESTGNVGNAGKTGKAENAGKAETGTQAGEYERPRRGRGLLKAVLGIAAALLLALVLWAALGRIAPDFVDKILYSPEELEIINYKI